MAMVFQSNPLKNEEGFTLNELLVVIVIIGIIGTVVFPNAYEIYANHILNTTAKEIVSNLRQAQQLAISKEKNVTVTFLDSVDIYSFKLYGDSESYKTVELPDQIEMVEADFASTISYKMDFYTNGRTVNGTVSIRNNLNKYLFIVVFQTGRIRITDTAP